MKQRLLVLITLAGCTATVKTAPPPNNPPPAQPVVVTQPPPPPPRNEPAPPPSKHPAYLRALSDLRGARAFLERPANAVVKWDEKRAIGEIDAAIKEIKEASIDDGKNLGDHPPVDVGMVWGDRLHKALELTEAARRDVNEEEDNAFARGLKNRALGHIDLATRDINEGIADAQKNPPEPPHPGVGEGAHPAYLHALSDLRAARFFLQKPDKPDVKWDEQHAIREIDEAMKEIKEAAIDDGKDLNDHPGLDAAANHRTRLVRAAELLEQAANDIDKREDNKFAKGLRARATGHIRDAAKLTREAIKDKKEDAKEERKAAEKREEKAEKKEDKKAEQADKKADKAEVKAEKAEAKAEKADAKATKADKDAAKADKAADKAKKDADKAKADADKKK